MVQVRFDPVPKFLSGVCWRAPRYYRNKPMTRTHSHPEIEANVIESGVLRYLVDDRVQTLTRGDLFWLFPEQQHMILEASPDLSFWVFLVRPEFLAQRAPAVPLTAAADPQFTLPRRLREAERLHLHSVATALIETEDNPQHHANGLAWWFAEAMRMTRARSGRVGRPMHPAIVNALALLDTDPSLPLPDLARAVHMSASRLSHLFAEQVERSVSAHRNHLKLRRFQEALQSGESRNLTQAAFDAGFGSYAQCARVLRASAGITPRELLGATPVDS